MSNLTQHPDELSLLQYLDGELSARETRTVKQHLETCWQCRTSVETLEQTIAECVRYRNQVLRPNLPSPPAPWMDFYTASSRVESDTGRVSFLERLVGPLRKPWLIPVAVTAAVMGILLVQWRETPSVQAAQLLRKAAVAADARPAKQRRIRLVTSTRNVTRVVGATPAVAGPEDPLAAMFRAAQYDWDDPLSAKAFESWRGHLSQKHDEVASTSSEYTIRTSTDSGELASASLKLRASDFQPVEGRLEFRNKETVEITELPVEPMLAGAAPAAEPGAPADVLAHIDEPHPASAPGAAEELKVLAALHDVGADLGDPVEVNRTPDAIVVSGVGVPSDRQEKIRAALRPVPGVAVQFTEPAAAEAATDVPSTSESTAKPQNAKFQAQMERYLGGRAQYDLFSGQVLEASEAAMSRVYALRRLAQRFPAGSESTLDPASRATLTRICREHVAELARAQSNMAALAGPVLNALGGSGNAVQQKKIESQAWQPATEELFGAAQRVERLLATMLDGSPTAPPAADLPSRLSGALAELRSKTQSYRQHFNLEPSGDGK
jgi:anti-sigma factor RsiW